MASVISLWPSRSRAWYDCPNKCSSEDVQQALLRTLDKEMEVAGPLQRTTELSL